MKSTSLVAALAAFGFLSVTGASAQILIDWGVSQQMQGDSDIATNGTYFDAVNTASTFSTTTVGTTTFNAINPTYVGANSRYEGTDGTIGVTYNGSTYTGDGFSSATASADYLTVVNQGSDGNLGTVTIGSAAHFLTVGTTYQVEVWSVWSHGPYEAFVDGNPPVAFPYAGTQFAIGTFTANDTIETFDWTGNGGASTYAANVATGAYGFLNDILVESVPEPSTYALMAAGLMLVGFCARRKLALR